MINAYQLSGRLSTLYWLGKTQLFYRLCLGALGKRSRIIKPLKMQRMENIFIGNHVSINEFTWLLTLSLEGTRPRLTIKDGCDIGHFNHITCVNYVEIGAKVLTADKVFISDNGHAYENPLAPIIDQPILSKGAVVIGEGTWLGENVSVLSCRIGRNCVIGANSVVTRDIPDLCVAVGAPARVIKSFDEKAGRWVDYRERPDLSEGSKFI